MSIFIAVCLVLLGMGFGALSTWFTRAATRRQVQHEFETQVDQALFGRSRPQELAKRESGSIKHS